MDGNKKEGVSVKEIEQFAKKHRFEVFFCLMFFLAGIFSMMGSFRPGWSLFLAMVGSILGVLLPSKIAPLVEKAIQFVFRQDTTLQIVFGVVALILACVIPFIIFLMIGIVGGWGVYQMATTSLPRK